MVTQLNLGSSAEQTCFTIQQDTDLLSLCVDSNSISSIEDSVGPTDLDFLWILVCGFLVMLMQLGFTLVEVGAVRFRSTINIMFKNLCDFCVGCVVWYLFGWALTAAPSEAYDNEFWGAGDLALNDSKDYLNWFFSMVFAATAATIVSGAVAERTTLTAYVTYSFLLTAWVYPIVVYWVWSGTGWLSAGKKFQMIDFAGSSVVHMVGGWSGLVGAIFLGKRNGSVDPHSVVFQVMGVFILWFGWYGFNCGSTLSAVGQLGTAARVAATTTMSGACAGLGGLSLSYVFEGKLSVVRMCNGILAGLVGITANCHVVELWGAIIIGFVSSGVYFAASNFVAHCGIDDPLDAFAVHGATGFWACLASALIGTEELIKEAGYLYEGDIQSFGTRFRNQFVGCIAIAAWTTSFSIVIFGGLQALGMLRVDAETERKGLNSKHEDAAAWNFKKQGTIKVTKEQMAKTFKDEDDEENEEKFADKQQEGARRIDEFDEEAVAPVNVSGTVRSTQMAKLDDV